MSSVVYREIQVKGALNAVRGMPFGWSLNPFLGCAHACYYCFSRAYHVRYREKNVVTEGPLVVRDIDVLRKLDEKTELTVYFSVPCVDEDIVRKTDPGTAPPRQRLRALRMLREAGIDAAVLCMPVLPGISDSEESLDRAAKAASEAGATAFRHRLLKIDREIRDYYFEFLAREFPTLLPRYSALYAGGNHPGRDYEREL